MSRSDVDTSHLDAPAACPVTLPTVPTAGVPVGAEWMYPTVDDDLILEPVPVSPFCNATHVPYADLPDLLLVCDLLPGHAGWHTERFVARWERWAADPAVTEWFHPADPADPSSGGRYLPYPNDPETTA